MGYTQNHVLDIDYPNNPPVIMVKPHTIPEFEFANGTKVYKRNHEVLVNTLAAADYKCEEHCQNTLFLRKNGITPYTEGHHLIPLKYQERFDSSLDVEANIISLSFLP